MCGLTGIWQAGSAPAASLSELALRMAGTLAHRGPDDQGVWVEESERIVMSHRRLSIVDLSPLGHQPMHSASGRYVVTFNGELYNFEALRKELEAGESQLAWRGRSDTEVLLAAVERWGVDRALRSFVGMFVFALWDRQERVLHLARDRFGEKPLYYGRMRGCFLFASELKALRAHPSFDASIDRQALALYLRYGCVPAPHSIYAGISKLMPGTVLSLTKHDLEASEAGKVRTYWSVCDAVTRGMTAPFGGGDAEAIAELERVLQKAVGGQMVADVPLGAFLSGGVDSSAIVALMQAQSARPIRTFSIGFQEEAYNEAVHAKRVAQHLGTDHTELYLAPREALDVVPDLADIYDEPFADSSQIPTYLVSKLARRHVTVSLSGDGGDELFGGYNRYVWGPTLGRRIGWVPHSVRSSLRRAITRVTPATWDRTVDRVSGLMPASTRQKAVGDKLHKLAGLLDARDDTDLYQRMVSFWPVGMATAWRQESGSSGWLGSEPPAVLHSLPERMMYWDALGYLPDDILVKVDRAAMAVSLETRVPFLDHRVFEFASSLPLRFKIRAGCTKWILRELLYRYVPRELVERPKMGFGVPIDTWLRGPLRSWAESLLDESKLRGAGLLDPLAIRSCWQAHLAGARNWQHRLWAVLMFQAWLERWQAVP
jgi:asparagine synthase (glutamine-hydrolysing)